MSRFGEHSGSAINEAIRHNTPANTIKCKKTVWKQFLEFCTNRSYELNESTSDEQLATILKDWAYNMRKKDGQDYKETVIKTMWNVTAKQIQEKYAAFGREVDPFSSAKFREAREAKNSKRKELQAIPEKRKQSSSALKKEEFNQLIDIWNEDTPEGLQKKFFLIASVELAWRGGEASSCLLHYFKRECGNDGTQTTRIEYNPVFTKTTQGGSQKCANSKWLIRNKETPANCPVRLFEKLISKRTNNIKTDRLFLTVNPFWNQSYSIGWYKNCPIGKNELSKWMKDSASKAGFDVKNKKITNHSSRATAVSSLAKAGIGEQQLIQITGHSNPSSIKPYLQLDEQHHERIVLGMRHSSTTAATTSARMEVSGDQQSTIFNNCVFNCTNLYVNK